MQQPELPWNVAGIAPEAREAARASARREGLSVGEWLTRRILRALSDGEASPDAWLFQENRRGGALAEGAVSSRDALRTPARDLYSDVRNGSNRTEERLHGIVQRLAEREYDRKDGSRGFADVALRPSGDADGFERLTGRIKALEARIVKIESTGAAESTKQADAVKGLQTKIAELSERTSAAASRGVSHTTELAKAVQALAGKLSEARLETDRQGEAVAERISALAEDVAAVSQKLEHTRTDLAESVAAVSEKLEHTRTDLAEGVAAVSDKLEQTRVDGEREGHVLSQRVGSLETVVDALGRDRDAVAQLDGSLHTLARRVEVGETEYLNNIEHLETRLTRIEANAGDATIDRRLQGIEQALADMAAVISRNAKPAAEQSQAAVPQPPPPETRDAAPHVPPFGTESSPPILDLPPFPPKPEIKSVATPADPLAASLNGLRANTPDDSSKRPFSADVESFLAAARRNARAASDSQPRSAAFSWTDPVPQEAANDGAPWRLLLLAGLGLLVLAAIGTGLYMSNNYSRPAPASETVTIPARHAAAPKAQPVQPPVSLITSVAPPKSSAAPAAAKPPVREHATAAPPHRRAAVAPKRPEAPATTAAAASTAAQTKPLSPLQRLEALAKAGNSKAQEVLGLQYVDGDGVTVNEAEGAKWLERSATQGEAVAAYRLGTLYERGRGVAASQPKAAQWYTVAAKAGNRKAMHNLAVAYAQGAGVHKDMTSAAQWFLRAANLGLADSQFNLAVLYERGMGVQQSLPEAYKWYAIAAAQGDAESKTRMDALATQLSDGDKTAAEKAAAAFQPAPLDGSANAPPIAASLVGG